MSENRLPNLPNSPMTTAELGMAFFDLAPDELDDFVPRGTQRFLRARRPMPIR